MFKILKIGSLFFCLCLFANQGFSQIVFCPKTMRYLKTGQTVQEVLAACGQPTSQREVGVPDPVESPTVSWFYSISRGMAGNQVQLIIHMQNGEVSGMSLSGQAVTSISVCQRGSVKVGDKDYLVRSYCGEPSLINIGSQQIGVRRKKVLLWIYKFGSFGPTYLLRFERNTLVKIEKR